MNQNPFNLYDFLGYLIPGMLFIFLFQHTGFFNIASFDASKFGDSELVHYTIIVVFAYVCGHIISIASSRTIEDYHIWLNGYPSKNLFVDDHKKEKLNFYHCLVNIFLFPLFLIDHICRNIFKHKSKTIDNSLKRIVLKKLIHFFKRIDKSAANEIKQSQFLCNELFRYINHYANETAKEHNSKFLNYVALYGFSRSLSLLFIILCEIEFFFVISKIATCAKIPTTNIILMFFSWFCGYIFYLSYAKFFRRYSQEVIMAFATNYHDTTK